MPSNLTDFLHVIITPSILADTSSSRLEVALIYIHFKVIISKPFN